jgi:MFS family permease
MLAVKIAQLLLPFYVTEKGGTALEVGIILSVCSMTILLSRIPLSAIAERIGRFSTLLLMIAGTTVAFFL